ncbi:MAG: lipoyl(octanoyl) transferase LipB [Deltaproteobacteria bacterium]|nr:lipoyl(octanoyl) transferase LipB [Deltaproteobacteria bacterium]
MLSSDPISHSDKGGVRPWLVVDIPLMGYIEALDLQHRLVHARHTGALQHDVILILEHPPVFTLGRRGGDEHLLVDPSFLKDRGIETHRVERGGYITYHGPGQVVVYPIVDLNRVEWGVVDWVSSLEEVGIRVAADWGITAERRSLNRGVWVENRKLAYIGIAVRHWITFHGMAINVDLSLEPFEWMNPCGLQGVQATSLARELNVRVPVHRVRQQLMEHLKKECRMDILVTSLQEVEERSRGDSLPA